MEIESPPKQLHTHAVPIVVIAVALLALPVIAFGRYNTTSQRTELALARGLVARILHVKPTPNGLARITLNNPATSATSSNAGSKLSGGLAQAGRTAQLSIYFSGAAR
jgi:hypothetical protein